MNEWKLFCKHLLGAIHVYMLQFFWADYKYDLDDLFGLSLIQSLPVAHITTIFNMFDIFDIEIGEC